MKKRAPKKTKLKKLAYEFLPPRSDLGAPIYRMLDELVDAYHQEVSGAEFAIAWNRTWTPDADGRCILGQCRKVSDLEREVFEVAGYDFIIILHEEFWLNPRVSDIQRRALLDHELMHAAVKYDQNGDPELDARGRTVYRIRKHDLEEFTEIVDRYGCYKADIEAFARALRRAEQLASPWVGYTSLAETLKAIGLLVDPTVIATWSEDERREVQTWALVRRETNTHVNIVTSQTIPPCVAAAVRDQPPAADQPTTH